MRKAYGEMWRRLGRVEKALLALLAVYALLLATGLSPAWQFLTGSAAVIVGLVVLVKWTRIGMRKAIWRLRNRLIVAYLFIAVVPIVLILLLAGLAGYTLIGQVAAYFVRTQLSNTENRLLQQAQFLTGTGGGPGGARGGFRPGGDAGGPPTGGGSPSERKGRGPEPAPNQGRGPTDRSGRFPGNDRGRGTFPPFPGAAGSSGANVPSASDAADMLNRQVAGVRNRFPEAELLITGKQEIRVPADSKLTPPPPEWGKANGLVLKDDGAKKRLYMWAHVLTTTGDVREATILWPVTSDLLARLEPRLSNVSISDYVPTAKDAQVPKAANLLDLGVRGAYPLQISAWASPTDQVDSLLVVSSRVSSVLGIIFEQRAGQRIQLSDMAQAFFLSVIGLFVFVEAASLFAGIKLTRSMTGAVHEIYQGTQHVKEGDFSYRIPVEGNDQLAEMGASFNTMTENLGQLIVVAKEKERLQSELEIAREVQNQLFPRDVPSSKSLELKGVCNPARVVSGDYYDFMAMPGSELAFAIGDVAGKGISAALLMATIQSTMRTQLSATNGSGPVHQSAMKLVAQLNRQLYANTTPEKYATFFFAIYDEAQCALTYTNAGHLPPMLVRNGEFSYLNPTGTVVGAFPFAKFEEKTVQLEEGDIVVAYTDGIVEPENPYGEMFGENRLKELILRHARAGSSEIIARTMEAVNQWTGTSELFDDMTMIVARRI